MSSAWENCAESCNLIFAPTLSVGDMTSSLKGAIGWLRPILRNRQLRFTSNRV